MGRHAAVGKNDADKNRAELITELKALRDLNSRLKDVVNRYERVAGKKDHFRSLYDLEANRESIESLRDELREKQKEIDFQSEELEVQNEELQVQLDELNALHDVARVNAALRESKERLDFSLNSAEIGAWDLNLIDHTAWRSLRHDQIFGYAEQLPEWTYEMFLDHVIPEDRGLVDSAFQKALIGHVDWDFECRIRRADGEVRWIWGRGRAMYGEQGQPLSMFGINVDITERKRAEEAVKFANSYNRSLIEASLDPLVTIASDGRITDVNAATETATGYPRGKLISTDFSDYFTDPAKAREGYRKVFKEGSVTDYPLEIKHVDGHITPVLYNATVYRDETGKVIGVFAAARDVTELKKTEEELSKARDKLEERVNERTDELQQSNNELSAQIEERKRVEEALRSTRDFLESLINYANAPIIVWDPAHKITRFNNAFEHMTGYAADEVVGKELEVLFPEDSREASLGKIQRTLTEHWESVEIPILDRDGRIRIALWNSANVYDKDGKTLLATIAQGQDITERKQAEEAHSMLASIVESSSDAIISKTLDGIITSWNKGAEQVYGYRMDEIIGKPVSILAPRDHPDEVPCLLEKIRHGDRTLYYDTIRVRKDGAIIDVSLTMSPIKDSNGCAIGVATIARDITERKRAEELLRETRDYLESLIKYTNAPIIVWDTTFTITQFNHAFERLSGYEASEVVGKNLDMLFPHERVNDSLIKIKGTLMGEYWESVEIPILRKDGGIRIALWNSANIHGEKGDLLATIAQGQDITERKQAEEGLIIAKAQAELYLDLMGHDINNMNQSAMGHLELALETLETDGKIGLDGKLLIEKPLQAINSSSKLIENVRKLQRLMTGSVKTWPIDLHDLLDELKAQDFHAGDNDVTVNFGQIPQYVVEGNELLGDVFYNLINNAVKHSKPDKPVTVDLRVERVDLDGRTFYRCAIEDDGPGIPDELKPKLFNRFQRGKTKAHGKGLGLYIVRTLVEGYHGKVWVEDRVPGDHTKGARFVVMLPAVDN
jgi:PAS domain S-box-containing protein